MRVPGFFHPDRRKWTVAGRSTRQCTSCNAVARSHQRLEPQVTLPAPAAAHRGFGCSPGMLDAGPSDHMAAFRGAHGHQDDISHVMLCSCIPVRSAGSRCASMIYCTLAPVGFYSRWRVQVGVHNASTRTLDLLSMSRLSP